ncbi:MAG: RNA-binding protein [Rhizobacter sp.]|nr:RNA-binding protein [Ferruginibacter sp.]
MNLYVSNLSFNTLDAELNDLFAEFGAVTSAKVIMDRDTGRSRGFGFVEMSSAEEGNAAIKALDNKMLEGRNMSVSVAKEKTERTGGGNNRNSYSNNKW